MDISELIAHTAQTGAHARSVVRFHSLSEKCEIRVHSIYRQRNQVANM